MYCNPTPDGVFPVGNYLEQEEEFCYNQYLCSTVEYTVDFHCKNVKYGDNGR